MRSPMVDLRVALSVLAIVTAATAACVIGPKQDDPLTGAPSFAGDASTDAADNENVNDVGTAASDSGGEQPADAASGDVGPMSETGTVDAAADAPTDADADADAPGDAVSDAPEGD